MSILRLYSMMTYLILNVFGVSMVCRNFGGSPQACRFDRTKAQCFCRIVARIEPMGCDVLVALLPVLPY